MSFAHHFVWIHAAAPEKLELTTDNGWTTNACAMTKALPTKSSRAKKEGGMLLPYDEFLTKAFAFAAGRLALVNNSKRLLIQIKFLAWVTIKIFYRNARFCKVILREATPEDHITTATGMVKSGVREGFARRRGNIATCIKTQSGRRCYTAVDVHRNCATS